MRDCGRRRRPGRKQGWRRASANPALNHFPSFERRQGGPPGTLVGTLGVPRAVPAERAYDSTKRSCASSSYGWQYLFQGMRLDSVTGAASERYRDSSTALGRWLQTDPIGFRGGDANTYRMEGNSPESSVDPTGLASCCSVRSPSGSARALFSPAPFPVSAISAILWQVTKAACVEINVFPSLTLSYSTHSQDSIVCRGSVAAGVNAAVRKGQLPTAHTTPVRLAWNNCRPPKRCVLDQTLVHIQEVNFSLTLLVNTWLASYNCSVSGEVAQRGR